MQVLPKENSGAQTTDLLGAIPVGEQDNMVCSIPSPTSCPKQSVPKNSSNTRIQADHCHLTSRQIPRGCHHPSTQTILRQKDSPRPIRIHARVRHRWGKVPSLPAHQVLTTNRRVPQTLPPLPGFLECVRQSQQETPLRRHRNQKHPPARTTSAHQVHPPSHLSHYQL